MAENTNVKKPSIFTRIKKFWKDYRSEFKKLVWPTPKQLLKNSAVVLVSVIVVGAVLSLVDFSLSRGFYALQDVIKQIMPAG